MVQHYLITYKNKGIILLCRIKNHVFCKCTKGEDTRITIKAILCWSNQLIKQCRVMSVKKFLIVFF
uniref:Putative ovule protein n=1 Tax=Solanum chacoense TaxID=4108 RepID=A0A0V0HLT8_SOLCH